MLKHNNRIICSAAVFDWYLPGASDMNTTQDQIYKMYMHQ